MPQITQITQINLINTYIQQTRENPWLPSYGLAFYVVRKLRPPIQSFFRKNRGGERNKHGKDHSLNKSKPRIDGEHV